MIFAVFLSFRVTWSLHIFHIFQHIITVSFGILTTPRSLSSSWTPCNLRGRNTSFYNLSIDHNDCNWFQFTWNICTFMCVCLKHACQTFPSVLLSQPKIVTQQIQVIWTCKWYPLYDLRSWITMFKNRYFLVPQKLSPIGTTKTINQPQFSVSCNLADISWEHTTFIRLSRGEIF